MSWNEEPGTVTRAFDEWRMTDGGIRGYVVLGVRVVEEAYERIWKKAAQEPAGPDGPELVDVFDDRINGSGSGTSNGCSSLGR